MTSLDRIGADPLFLALDRVGSPAFVIDRGPDGRFAFAHLNRQHERISGLVSRDVRGHPLAEFFPPRLAETVCDNFRACVARETPVVYDEVLSIDGAEIWWRTTLNRTDGPCGPATRIVGTATDVTDAKRREVAHATEMARLRDCMDDLRAFAGLTAHDMRGPLSNVISLTDMILDGFVDMGNGKAEMIGMCREVADTSLAAIDEIMRKVEATAEDARVERQLSLGRLCRDLSALIDPARRLAVTFPSASVATDDTVLRLALRNVMENASRFCETAIEVCLAEDAARGTICLTVTDDGPGVAAGHDPVRAAAEGAPARADGRGYGLRTVVKLLRNRGGDLALESPAQGEGARFRITLPGRIVADADPA